MARAEELRSILEVTPASIWIARDPECRTVTGSDLAFDVLLDALLAPAASGTYATAPSRTL